MLRTAVMYFGKRCTCFLIVVTERLIRSKERLAFFFFLKVSQIGKECFSHLKGDFCPSL